MGLDIDKCKVIKKSKIDDEDNYLILTHLGNPIKANKYFEMLQEKFKDFVTNAEFEHYDIEKAFSDMGLDCKDYLWESIGETIVFYNKNNHDETITFDEISFPTRIVTEKIIHYQEVDYQRKGMTPSFYKEVVAGSFKANDENQIEEYESMDYVLNNDDLEKVKTYSEDDSSIRKWFLENDEFISFCY